MNCSISHKLKRYIHACLRHGVPVELVDCSRPAASGHLLSLFISSPPTCLPASLLSSLSNSLPPCLLPSIPPLHLPIPPSISLFHLPISPTISLLHLPISPSIFPYFSLLSLPPSLPLTLPHSRPSLSPSLLPLSPLQAVHVLTGVAPALDDASGPSARSQLAWHPDGSLLATPGRDKDCVCYDRDTADVMEVFKVGSSNHGIY